MEFKKKILYRREFFEIDEVIYELHKKDNSFITISDAQVINDKLTKRGYDAFIRGGITTHLGELWIPLKLFDRNFDGQIYNHKNIDNFEKLRITKVK